MRAILYLAAFVVPFLAGYAAHLAGAGWIGVGLAVAVALIAILLASRHGTTEEQLADIGRGAIVAMIVGFSAAWIDHEAAARSARQSLALSLSSGSAFAGIDLHGKDLSGYYIADKDLENADLHGANLRDAVLRGSKLGGANLHGADLTGADLRDADLSGPLTDLTDARLERSTLIGAKLGGARLIGANLRNADLTGANLSGSDLRETQLPGAVLAGADLRLALLVDADLRNATLSADLRQAKLDGAALAGAAFDRTTRWPPGFDPRGRVAQVGHEPSKIDAPSSAISDRVVRVVDGDTLVLEKLGGVRLLGINAPTSDVAPIDCYGPEATAAVRRIIPAGTTVKYTLSSPSHDDFGRALAYVWANGLFVNREIVEQGAAEVLISPPHTTYASELRRAATRAANKRAGLWSACVRPSN